MPRPRLLLAAAAVLLAGACDDPNELPNATIPNVVDTVTINAVRGTPPNAPSGFDLVDSRPVRIDQTIAFDFIFDFTDALEPVFVPIDLLGLVSDGSVPPGFIPQAVTFDAITIAVSNGYSQGDTLRVAEGDVLLARSRLTCSNFGGLPLYGKLHIIDVDAEARQVTFEHLVDLNCGYRGLLPGLPPR
ncbi:MAG TPA: hypothetical protein VJ773_07450 [Gemmatimonadales bacterium]|nr:hypothetical protein [Gemmatimonadales bacterium]